MVSRLPLDAHPPILPRAGAVAPGPADTLVSPGIGQSRGSLLLTSRDTLISDPLHMLTEMETRDARCVCVWVGGNVGEPGPCLSCC